MAKYYRLTAILAIYVALAILYGARLPLWETPDEPAHVEFIRYLELHGTLPTRMPDERAATPTSAPGNEFVQVPAYYVVMSPLLAWIWLPPGAQWHRNPYVTWPGHPNRLALAFHRADEAWPYQGLSLFAHLARLISVVFGLVTLVASYHFIRLIAGSDWGALAGTAWLAWSPGFLLSNSRVSNDAFAAASSALLLFVCARFLLAKNAAPLRALFGLSLLLAATLLAKLNTAYLLPLAATGVLIRDVKFARAEALAIVRRLSGRLGIVLAPSLGALGVWWLAVGRQFGHVVGQQGGFGVADPLNVLPYVSFSGIASALWTLNLTWWGLSQFESEIVWPPPVYVFLIVPTVVLLVSGIARLVVPSPNASALARRAALLAVLAALPLIYATIARGLVPTIGYAAQARFILPAMPVLALVIALGGRELAWQRATRWLFPTYLAGILAVAIGVPFVLFPQINPPTIPARLARDSAEADAPAIARYANGVELAGVDGIGQTPPMGQALPLTLHWRVTRNLDEDFTASVKLVSSEEQRVAGTDAVPFEKSFPPHLWQTGEYVDQMLPLTIPPRLKPGVYAIQVSLYRWHGGNPEPLPLVGTTSTSSATTVGQWRVLPDSTPPSDMRAIDARFGNDLTLFGYTLARGPSDLQVSLFWRDRARTSQRLVVSVQALDTSGRLIAQNDEEPVGGSLPTTTWRPGDTIRDDRQIHLPTSDALAQVDVVVYDRQTSARLPVVVGGALSSDHAVLAGAR